MTFVVATEVHGEWKTPYRPDAYMQPFTDYLSGGFGKVQLSTLTLSYEQPIVHLPGRNGFDLNLKLQIVPGKDDQSYYDNDYRYDHPFITSYYWRIIGLPLVDGRRLTLADGRVYSFYSYSESQSIDCGDIIVTYDADSGKVIFSNGLILTRGSAYIEEGNNVNNVYEETLTDPNGNTIKIKLQQYGYIWKVVKITDSIGRVILIKRHTAESPGDQISQVLADGTIKPLLTMNLYAGSRTEHIDAAGRKTTFNQLWSSNNIYTITHHNGMVEEYVKNYYTQWSTVYKCNLYYPGQTAPFKTITYTTNFPGITFAPLNAVTVNDGISLKKYTFDRGYPTTEETYNSSGSLLLKRTDTRYLYKTIEEGYVYLAWPENLKNCFYSSDGSLNHVENYSYQYDEYHNVTSIFDPSWVHTHIVYANTDCPDKDKALYTTGVGHHQKVMQYYNSPVHGIHYKYDPNTGNLLQVSQLYRIGDSDEYFHTYYTYDGFGNVLTKTDANGNQLCYTYGEQFKNAYLTEISDASGKAIVKYDYDFDTGNRIMAMDARGIVINYKYDAVNRLIEESLSNPDPKLSYLRRITYDDANNTVMVKYGNDTVGWQETLVTYDAICGKPTLVQRKVNGNWVTQEQSGYDGNGRLIWKKDGMGHQTTFTYDALDRQTQIIQPDGAITQFTYDDWTVTTTDANGNTRELKYKFAPFGQQVNVKESPDQGATSYLTTYTYRKYYDNSSGKLVYRLLKTVNPRNATTINTYDNLGRLIRIDYPQDGENSMASESFTYDKVGNLLTKTDGKGTKQFAYEFFGGGYRLKTVTEPDGNVVSYTYDANGNLLTQNTRGVSYTYEYDVRNRVTQIQAQLDGYSFNIGYDYDTFGRVTGITYPGRSTAVNYTYDDLDLLRTIPGFVESCSYDAGNKLTEMVLANGITNSYSYDSNNRPIAITAGGLMNLTYSYDPVGNITKINDDCFGYDGLNRLIWYGNTSDAFQSGANGTQWSYDGAGNMTEIRKYQNGQMQESITLGYDLANRLLTAGNTTYGNSAAGERISKTTGSEAWSYIYDGESRLTKVIKNDAVLAESFYDGAGMRYKKVENGKTTYYIYSGSNPLVEYSPTDGQFTYRIYAGKNAVAEETDGVIKFYHKDHLGSTRIVTDAFGNKVAEYKYAPYGEKETSSGTGTDYQFTDKANDDSTGLTYFGARFYDPEVGRFLTDDPARQGLNWYAYCGNNPIKNVDPDGRAYDIFDVGFFAWSARDFINNPSLATFGWMLADGVALIPGVPSTGYFRRGIQVLNKVDDGIKGTKKVLVALNRESGKAAEEFLAKTYGGIQQVFKNTSLGGRFIDNLVDGVAREAKVGRTSLTKRVQKQIAKDLELMNTPGSGVTSVEWHFFQGKTGIGPTKQLLKALEEAGITVVIH